MMLSTSQLFLDNNSSKWDISFTASSPILPLSLSIGQDFVSSKTSMFLKMGDSWIPAKRFSTLEQILDTVSL